MLNITFPDSAFSLPGFWIHYKLQPAIDITVSVGPCLLIIFFLKHLNMLANIYSILCHYI